MPVAVIDLGTNTFNLLIAKKANKGFQILYNHKIPVKLGEKRINDGEIIPEAYQRGIKAIHAHYKTIQQYKVKQIKAFGTSALRSAQNGKQFLNDIKKDTGIDVEIITGDREAELICKGVSQTIELRDNPILILDIGGGSNELIITSKHGIAWKKSYPLGIARLIAQFSPSDPLTKSEVNDICLYLDKQLEDLFQQIKQYGINTLVGASGSFETFVAMIAERNWVSESAKKAIAVPILLADFNALYHKLIFSTTRERSKMRGLEPMRIEMIVLAALFVKFISDKAGIKNIYQSAYALKEGAITELI